MRSRGERKESGQAFGEYALIVAGVAVVCAFVILFLGTVILGLIDSDPEPGQPGPFTPPVQTSDLRWPAKLEDCEDGKWRNYVQFHDEQECKEYVRNRRP